MPYCYQADEPSTHQAYHDTEWGEPLFDDRKHFEFIIMEVMQCGLSWGLMMQKRAIFNACFDHADYDKIARYDEEDIVRIINTDGMIRSERKIRAVINNARCFGQIRRTYGSFSDWLWAFSAGKVIVYDKHADGFIPASNGLSDKISRELKRFGFKFLGSVTVYSHLQACGIINDHSRSCPRFEDINARFTTLKKRRYLEKNIGEYGA